MLCVNTAEFSWSAYFLFGTLFNNFFLLLLLITDYNAFRLLGTKTKQATCPGNFPEGLINDGALTTLPVLQPDPGSTVLSFSATTQSPWPFPLASSVLLARSLDCGLTTHA